MQQNDRPVDGQVFEALSFTSQVGATVAAGAATLLLPVPPHSTHSHEAD